MFTTPDFINLHKDHAQFRGFVQAYLTEFYDKKVREAKKADESFGATMQVISDFMLRRGKSVRSYIAKTAYQLAGGTDHDAIVRVGAAIETNHYFLLSIDDIVDRDTVRHGGPTMELMFREMHPQIPKDKHDHYARSFTEIACSLMYSHVFEMLGESQFPPEKIVEVIGIVVEKMLHAPATGWQIHMLQNFDSLANSSEARFVKGLTFVTAEYTFVGPLMIGLTFAGANQAYKDVLSEYGKYVGTAFQVQDDILGLFGNPAVTGKSAGNDVREGKKTLLLQHAYANASATDKMFLEQAAGADLSEKEVQRVKKIVESTGSLDYSKKMAREMVDKGKAALEPLKGKVQEKYLNYLEDIAEFVILRDR